MATADYLPDLLRIWSQSGQDAERLQAKFVEDGIDRIMEVESPLAAKFKRGKDTYNPIVRWIEQRDYELQVTGDLASNGTFTVSGYLLGAAVTANAMRQHIKVGTVLESPTGFQVKVTAVSDYTTLTCTVEAHGNTGSLATVATTTWDIIGDSVSDYDTTYIPRALERTWRSCGTQRVKENIEMAWTKMATKMEGISDEFQWQLQSIMTNLEKKISVSLVRMMPTYDSGYKFGLNVEAPTVCGLTGWMAITQGELANTDIYKNMSGVEIDVDTLNNWIMNFEVQEKANYNSGDWYLACGAATHQYLSDMFAGRREFAMTDTKSGFQVKSFLSKIGKEFPILRDLRLRKDQLLLVDVSGCEWGYYGDNHIKVVPIAQDNSAVTKKMITGVFWGLKMRKPRQSLAMIYGLPTTYA